MLKMLKIEEIGQIHMYVENFIPTKIMHLFVEEIEERKRGKTPMITVNCSISPKTKTFHLTKLQYQMDSKNKNSNNKLGKFAY